MTWRKISCSQQNSKHIPLPTDEPSAPGTPEIVDYDKDFVELEWAKPKNDGGAPIEGYVIEKREKGSTRWQEAMLSPIKGTKYKVDGLPTNKELEFRVAAVNKAGKGKYSECSEPQKTKAKFGEWITVYVISCIFLRFWTRWGNSWELNFVIYVMFLVL